MKEGWILNIGQGNAEDDVGFLVWYEDDLAIDRVLTHDGAVLVFASEQAACAALSAQQMHQNETVFFDAKTISDWTFRHQPVKDLQLLDFWNLFMDIARSIGQELEPVQTKRSERCYHKLFVAQYPFSATSGGNDCALTRKERKYVREVMKRGFSLLREHSRRIE